ncbi:MAG: TetR/AcrR family transcriptional regulator [Candidatus Binatia bacterium]
MSLLSTDQAPDGRRLQNKAAKLAKIERAARRLFAKQGFHDTTTRELAAAAGIGTGTLFLYFPGKKDLLIHLFKQDIAAVEEVIFAGLDRELPLRSALLHVFDGLYGCYERDLPLARVFIQELLFLDAGHRRDVGGFTAEFLQRLVGLIEAARARGELGGAVDAAQLAYAAFGLYCFTLINWLGGLLPSRDAARLQLRASLVLLLSGHLARGPR